MDRVKRSFFIGAIISALSIGTSLAADPPAGKPGKAGGPPGGMAMPVEATTVESGTATLDINAVGSLRANESVIIRAEIPGRITDIHFSEGQTVQQGAPLVNLDASEFQAQLAESATSVKLNNLNFKRAQEMAEKKLLSRQSYDEAQAKLAQSRASQAFYEARLAKTKLHAPFAGVLGLRQVSPGEYVQAGQDIVNLEDISSLKLDFNVPESYLAKVQQDQDVEVRVDAYPEQVFRGKIYAINPRIDEKTRTLLLRAVIPNPDGRLRPGMFARVSLILERRANALLVPEQALVPKGTDQVIYRVNDGKALPVKVTIGQRRDGKVEIIAGLNAGDTIVVAGQAKLRDGMPVKIVAGATAPPQQAAKTVNAL